jgi:hypothetical protein
MAVAKDINSNKMGCSRLMADWRATNEELANCLITLGHAHFCKTEVGKVVRLLISLIDQAAPVALLMQTRKEVSLSRC